MTEDGSVDGIRFLDATQVKMYDGEGNEVLCKCGKQAYAAWCNECALATEEAAEFVYRTPTRLTPTEEQIKKLESIGRDQWEIDLSNW